jgi:osmoprotectant transport system permease protein
MSPAQTFWRVELPQALPVIVGGVRLASIALISLATLASWIDAGGLGALVLYGLQHDDPSRAVAGAIAAAFLAITVDIALRILQDRWSRGSAVASRG